MTKITHKTIAKHLTNSYRLSKFNYRAIRIYGKPIFTKFEESAEAYSSFPELGKPSIVVGKYYTAIKILDQTPDTEVTTTNLHNMVKISSIMLEYLHAHECGHPKYTDMLNAGKYFNALQDKGYNTFAKIFSELSNIIEDIFLEANLKNEFPWLSPCLIKGRALVFNSKSIKVFEDNMTEDVWNLMSFLLLKYRGVKATLTPHPLFTPMAKELATSMYLCLSTLNPLSRLKRSLAFAYELYNHFYDTAKDFDLTQIKPGKDYAWILTLPVIVDPVTPPSGTATGLGSNITSGGGTKGGRGVTSAADKQDPDVDNGVKDPTSTTPSTPPTPAQLTDNGGVFDSASIDELTKKIAGNEPVIGYPHENAYINDHFKTHPFTQAYLDIVEKHEDTIFKLVKLIKDAKATNFVRYIANQRRGTFDKRVIGKVLSDPLAVYKKRIAPAPVADLAMSLVVDNSGSMYNYYTFIAGEAAIILAETCSRAGIPFEVLAFNSRHGIAHTIDLVRFGDKFNDVKTNLTLFTSRHDIPSLATFSANVDEASIDFAARRFMATRTEKDKVMIVISDGATCGDSGILKELVTYYNTKIDLIGIGVYADNVAATYANHFIIDTTEELNTLPTFMGNLVKSKIFK